MQSLASLQQLGLSEPEAAVYMFLAQNGPSSAPQVQAALGLDKVPAYRALGSLDARDLIITTGDKRRQRYIAQPATKLLHQYDRHIDELRHAKAEMQAFIESLSDKDNQLYKQRNIQVLDGIEGYRLWINERLRDDVRVIRQISSSKFWQDFNARGIATNDTLHDGDKRAAKGIELRSIFTSRDNPKHSVTRPDNLKYTRYLALPAVPAINLSTFGPRVGYYSADGDTRRGVIIEDKLFANLLVVIFDLLWEQAEQV